MHQYLPIQGKGCNLECARLVIGLSVNYDSARGPAGNLRLYDPLKEQNQLAGHLMTGANIRGAVGAPLSIDKHRNHYHRTHQQQTMK